MAWKYHALGDVAEIRRARGEAYPAGTIYIQVSATHGEIEMLEEEGTLEGKYAVILPKIDVVPLYFFNMLTMAAPEFMHKYVGKNINIQVGDLRYMKVRLHDSFETQLVICEVFSKIDKAVAQDERIIETLKESKKVALHNMFI